MNKLTTAQIIALSNAGLTAEQIDEVIGSQDTAKEDKTPPVVTAKESTTGNDDTKPSVSSDETLAKIVTAVESLTKKIEALNILTASTPSPKDDNVADILASIINPKED